MHSFAEIYIGIGREKIYYDAKKMTKMTKTKSGKMNMKLMLFCWFPLKSLESRAVLW